MNCSFCCKTYKTFEKLTQHIVIIHSNENNFKINCNFNNCEKVFTHVYSFKTHVFRKHYNALQNFKTSKTIKPQCLSCKKSFLNFSQLCSHYREHCANGQLVTCPVTNCNKTYNSYSSFTSHLSRIHPNQKEEASSQPHGTESNYYEQSCMGDDESEDNQTIDQEAQLKRNFALLQLKIQEKYMVPQGTVQKIMQDYKSIFQLNFENTVSKVKLAYENKNLDRETVEHVLSILEPNSLVTCFEQLNSIHNRKKFYKEEFSYVEPVELVLGVNNLNKDCVYQYIPILESLKFLLKQESVLSQVLNPLNNSDILSDFRDGAFFKQHPIFSKHPTALQVFLYCDEFEVCNPIGVHRKVHKMIAFYFVLGNIYPKYRSTTDCIQLAILCKSVYIKKFGLSQIVHPLVKDLSKLSEVGINACGMHFNGALAYISADNLASHFIGGFLESFSPNVKRPCRTCLSSNEEIKNTFIDSNIVLRTKDNYNLQVIEVENEPLKSTDYGLKTRSPFVDSNFHVVEGLPPDIAHDILEGVAPYEIGLVLEHLIVVDKLFSLDFVNSTIETFPYGPLDVLDKPCTIPNSFKVSQTASRMWCLVRLIPLMLYKLVPEGNLYWSLLLDLKTIIDIVFSHVIDVDHIALLKLKICDHLQLFHELFPTKNLRPKQHFLIHYAQHMLNFGPLKRCWTLRFEAKHFYFKRLATVGKNFKQLGSTLAVRHQLHQSYCAASENYLKSNVVLGSKKNVSVHCLENELKVLLDRNMFVENNFVSIFSFVSINALKYSYGLYICTDFINDEPVFGSIDYVVKKQGSVYLVVKHAETQFHEHCGAYIVRKISKWSLFDVEKLNDVYPLSPYFSDNFYFIVPKHMFLN